MTGSLFLLRLLLGVIFSYWLIQTLQTTILPKHFRFLKQHEVYLATAVGAILYLFLPIIWLILVIGLYIYHFKLRSPRK